MLEYGDTDHRVGLAQGHFTSPMGMASGRRAVAFCSLMVAPVEIGLKH
jgi:hypothetical protein